MMGERAPLVRVGSENEKPANNGWWLLLKPQPRRSDGDWTALLKDKAGN